MMPPDEPHRSMVPNTQDFLTTFEWATVGNDKLIDPNASKNIRNRLQHFVRWLDDNGHHWARPHLKAYSIFLQSDARMIQRGRTQVSSPLSARSAAAHLATIRGRYHRLIADPEFKANIGALADGRYPSIGQADRHALVQGITDYMKAAIDPEQTKDTVQVTTVQNKEDGTRLTAAQVNKLIAAPGIYTAGGLRDTAILMLMLTTGLREAEVCALNVDDLRRVSQGEWCVRVKTGKGNKQRFVPWGELADTLVVVDAWLRVAGITSGAVFRGFKERHTPNKPLSEMAGKLPERISDNRFSTRQLQRVIKAYPVMIDGQLTSLRPHDLRRTYARCLYASGMDIIAIQHNLGHASIKTTQDYIGEGNMSDRAPRAVFTLPYDLDTIGKL